MSMKRKKTGLLALILILFMMIGMGGCNMISYSERKEQENEQIISEMETHLRDKYGEIAYETNQLLRSGFEHDYDLMYLTAERTDGNTDIFWVRRYAEEGGGYRFEDNYYWLAIREEYETYMTTEMTRFFGTCKVFVGSDTADPFPNEITGAVTFDEIRKNDAFVKHTMWVLVDNASFKNTKAFQKAGEKFRDSWSEKHPTAVIRVFYMDKNQYGAFDRYNMSDIIGDGKVRCYLMEINNRP